MVRTPIRFLLEEVDHGRVVRFVAGEIALSEGVVRSWVTLTRTGSFTDPRYGRFEITPTMLASMVSNFKANTYGQEVFLDVSHEPEKGSAARILQLKADGNRLRAEVEWTPYGIAAVRERGFRYLSADFFDDYIDNEAGKSHGPLLRGAGLTIRPVIKRLDPVQLSESDNPSGPVLLSPGIVRHLTDLLETDMNKRLEKLLAKLKAKGITLSEATIKILSEALTAATKTLAETDEADAVVDHFVTLAEQINAAPPGTPITLSVQAPGIDASGIEAAVAKALAERDTANTKRATTLSARQKIYDDALAAANGLSPETLKLLAGARDLITPEMTDDQVKRLADTQITQGNALEASRQLSQRGFPRPSGSPHVSVDESNGIKKLSEAIRQGVRGTAAHINGQLRAVADESKLGPYALKVLAEFDAQNGERLHAESKMLAGGVTNIADTALPASFQREVIVETLADLRILELVNADVQPTDSATHTIPYEVRSTATVFNDGIVYEGQPIHQAGVSQANVLAYIAPMKIAMELTNEVMHFSRQNANINWDAWGRNLSSNSRLARELMARRIQNEMQRAADMYLSVAVAAEAFDGQLNGTNSLIKLANFPLVRPYQARDLQGTPVGAAEAPITFTLNTVVISAYDGTNTQGAGTYYRVESYNLGLIRLVNQLGVPVTPADSGTNTIGYRYATNIAKQDTDVPASPMYYERHMNKLLQKFGAQKALLAQDRFVKPNFGLLSEVLHNMVTDAENFAANFKRAGTDTNGVGDLAEVKGVSCWGTNTDGDLGDERILIGERGNLFYRLAKVFAVGQPFEIFNSAGKPLGKKGAYGEEYSSICVPTPLRSRFTSVLAYSATGRTAAV